MINSKVWLFILAMLMMHASADNEGYGENTTYSKYYTSAALAYCDKTGHLSDPKDCCSASSWLDYIGFGDMYLGRQDLGNGEEVAYAIASNNYDVVTRPYRHFLVSWGLEKTKYQKWYEIEKTLRNYEMVDYDLHEVEDGTKVVEYFDRLYKRIRDRFFEDIESMIPFRKNNFQITFIGHSLGGAFAELAAFEFKQRYPDLSVSIVTFGAPRVGNFKFSSILAAG